MSMLFVATFNYNMISIITFNNNSLNYLPNRDDKHIADICVQSKLKKNCYLENIAFILLNLLHLEMRFILHVSFFWMYVPFVIS